MTTPRSEPPDETVEPERDDRVDAEVIRDLDVADEESTGIVTGGVPCSFTRTY